MPIVIVAVMDALFVLMIAPQDYVIVIKFGL